MKYDWQISQLENKVEKLESKVERLETLVLNLQEKTQPPSSKYFSKEK